MCGKCSNSLGSEITAKKGEEGFFFFLLGQKVYHSSWGSRHNNFVSAERQKDTQTPLCKQNVIYLCDNAMCENCCSIWLHGAEFLTLCWRLFQENARVGEFTMAACKLLRQSCNIYTHSHVTQVQVHLCIYFSIIWL